MHNVSNHDHGRELDWGRTSDDYAVYRPGYPPSFYRRLAALEVGLPGQRILDLGTGTGVLARVFAAQGCTVTGVDVAENQLTAGRRLADEAGLAVDFRCAPAEDTGLPAACSDVVTASQSWLYFDRDRAIAEVRRVLVPGGLLLTCHFCWLPRLDAVARRTEALALAFNPQWTAADWAGEIPAQPAWSTAAFRLRAMFWYDEPIAFTHETWRGRIRACRGVGAALSAEEVERFDVAHAALLAATVPAEFTVLHRIDAHLLEPR